MKSRKKCKKGNIKRIILNVALLFVILILFSMVTNFSLAKKSYNTYSILVNNNDTMWDIAKNICKKNNDLNIQNVIMDIQEINNLESTDIYVGQTLNLPIY